VEQQLCTRKTELATSVGQFGHHPARGVSLKKGRHKTPYYQRFEVARSGWMGAKWKMRPSLSQRRHGPMVPGEAAALVGRPQRICRVDKSGQGPDSEEKKSLIGLL